MKTSILGFILFVHVVAYAQTSYQNFNPGKIWKDDKGVHINAHGGGFLFYDDT